MSTGQVSDTGPGTFISSEPPGGRQCLGRSPQPRLRDVLHSAGLLSQDATQLGSRPGRPKTQLSFRTGLGWFPRRCPLTWTHIRPPPARHPQTGQHHWAGPRTARAPPAARRCQGQLPFALCDFVRPACVRRMALQKEKVPSHASGVWPRPAGSKAQSPDSKPSAHFPATSACITLPPPLQEPFLSCR